MRRVDRFRSLDISKEFCVSSGLCGEWKLSDFSTFWCGVKKQWMILRSGWYILRAYRNWKSKDTGARVIQNYSPRQWLHFRDENHDFIWGVSAITMIFSSFGRKAVYPCMYICWSNGDCGFWFCLKEDSLLWRNNHVIYKSDFNIWELYDA